MIPKGLWWVHLQVGLLNVNGYYDPLLALFDKAVEEGFLSVASRLILVSAPTAKELIDKMEVRTHQSACSCGHYLLHFYSCCSSDHDMHRIRTWSWPTAKRAHRLMEVRSHQSSAPLCSTSPPFQQLQQQLRSWDV